MNLFDFGQSLYNQGEFREAAHVLESFCAQSDSPSAQVTEALFYRLRIYTELEMGEKRLELEKQVLASLSTLDHKNLAVLNYVQGYNALMEKAYEESHFLFEKSLQHALESSCRFALAQALFGCVFSSIVLNKDLPAIEKKMQKLEVICEKLNRADLQISLLSLKADLFIHKGEFHRAVEYAWRAYDQVKFVKNQFQSLSIMTMLGYVYLKAGDQEKAAIYLQLAQRAVDASIYKQLSKRLARLLGQLSAAPRGDFDLILDEQNNTVTEKNIGTVDFKNQFILVDLMKLLMEHPGVAFSKEELVKKLWGQKYNPSVHDNTIYVTIKRIRSLIEPNPHHSKYILRSRNGYLLNQDSKVLIKNKEPLL